MNVNEYFRSLYSDLYRVKLSTFYSEHSTFSTGSLMGPLEIGNGALSSNEL